MSADKDKSPNKQIDDALKALMKAIKPKTAKKGDGEIEEEAQLAPDEIRAHVAVVAAAIKWEQVKHNIKDGEEFDPNSL